MKKRVLILSASPRKGGNSDLLCDEFVRGAKEAGHDTEKVFLRDKQIGYCTACDYCRTHNGECIHQDDMAELLVKMITADVLVMATPVYFYTMDAQMKTVIDRTVARYTELSSKEFYFIVTAADNNSQALERTLEGFRGFTDCCLTNPIEKGIIYGIGVWQKGEVQNTPAMRQAYEMGKQV